jgi:hypothetical protein
MPIAENYMQSESSLAEIRALKAGASEVLYEV